MFIFKSVASATVFVLCTSILKLAEADRGVCSVAASEKLTECRRLLEDEPVGQSDALIMLQRSAKRIETQSTWVEVVSSALGDFFALEDAFSEAALTVMIFMGAIVIISASKRRHAEKKKLARKVEGVKIPQAADEHEQKSRSPSPTHRPQQQLSSLPKQFTDSRSSRSAPSSAFAASAAGGCTLAETALAALAAPAPNAPADAIEGNGIASAVRRGRAADLPRLLAQARARHVQRGLQGKALERRMQELLVTALRACASARCFREGLAAYDHEKAVVCGVAFGAETRSSAVLWSVLLYVATEAAQYYRCKDFYRRLRTTGAAPSGNDLVNLARGLAHQRDLAAVQETLEDLRNSSVANSIDGFTRNRVVAACCAEGASDIAALVFASDVFGQPPDVVTYNTLMKDFARQGKVSQCFELCEELRSQGLLPSEVTYGILLDACLCAEDFEKACVICQELLKSGLRLNSVHCTSFMKGLVGAGRLLEASGMLEQMERSPDAKPDIITYSTLVKAYADQGEARAAAGTVHRMINRGTRADEIIFNSALAAFSATKESFYSATEVTTTLEAFLRDGLRPSTTTVSIVLKALAQCHGWKQSLELLQSMKQRFGFRPEYRLFAQLTQAALRENRGDVALEAVAAMQRSADAYGDRIDEATRQRLIRWATHGGQAEVVAKLQNFRRDRA